MERTTPFHTFASKDTGKFILSLLYWPNKNPISRPPTPISPAGTSVSGANMTKKFRHETLAESHNFVIRFALWIKIRTAFPTTHRQSCKAVFENLFECKKFKYTKINCRVKPESSFVRPYGAVHFNSETTVDLNFTFVVEPGNSEDNRTFRFCNSFQNFACLYLGFSSINGIRDSATSWNSLVELVLTRISGFDHSHELLYFRIHSK